MTDKQKRLVKKATQCLKRHAWFKELDLDSIPSDAEIDAMGFTAAVKELVDDAIFAEAYK